MKYLLILFVVALALAPLTHFLPSKRQRQIARMREYAAVHGLFVEFRDLPDVARSTAPTERKQQVIYYGKRLPPSRGTLRERRAWLAQDGEWRGLQRSWQAPTISAALPATVLAAGVDEGSCGIYWREDGSEADVQQIVDALTGWEQALCG